MPFNTYVILYVIFNYIRERGSKITLIITKYLNLFPLWTVLFIKKFFKLKAEGKLILLFDSPLYIYYIWYIYLICFIHAYTCIEKKIIRWRDNFIYTQGFSVLRNSRRARNTKIRRLQVGQNRACRPAARESFNCVTAKRALFHLVSRQQQGRHPSPAGESIRREAACASFRSREKIEARSLRGSFFRSAHDWPSRTFYGINMLIDEIFLGRLNLVFKILSLERLGETAKGTCRAIY